MDTPNRHPAMGGLPYRDLWLLPLVAILTVVALFAGAEAVARLAWPEQLTNACRTPDPVLGFRYRPNCVSVMKTPEGPWYSSTYNACGYRSDEPCGPLPPGRRRIALIGSSLSEGYLVPYDDTIAAQLAADLSRMCAGTVEVQNLGAIGYGGDRLIPRMDEALRLKPDAVLLVTAPFDLEESLAEHPAATAPSAAPGLQQRLFAAVKDSRALTVAQHFLFRDPSVYLPLYLNYGDKADFLRPPFSTRWQARLRLLDGLVGTLAERAHRAGIPFVIAFVPQAAEAQLMATNAPPQGVDPEALPAAVAAIAARHDAWFDDTSVALRATPLPVALFYIVDGHMSGAGHTIAAASIAHRLADEPKGPFGDCRTTRSANLGTPP